MRTLLVILSIAFVANRPASASAQPSTVIIVRHAEKTSATERDPTLSEAGIQRARDLGAALADAGVNTVIATNYQRTKLTAAEVMKYAKTMVEVKAGGPSHVADVVAAIHSLPAGQVVLVVGHSNTVTPIIAKLGGPKLPEICDSQYANMYILHMNGAAGPKLIRASFGKADPIDPGCVNTMK